MRKVKGITKLGIAMLAGIMVFLSIPMADVSAGFVEKDMFTDPMAIKGIQGFDNHDYDTRHRLNNVFIDECFHTPDEPVFANGQILPYTYKGKSYCLTVPDHIYYNVKEANRNNESVSICFLMRWSDKAQWLIDDAARQPGHTYYALETEGAAGEWLEAFFSFFCEEMGSENWNLHVDNFILGNEVNMPDQWNYFGSIDTDVCAAKYGEAYRIMYNVVRRYSSASRCSISLDHSWNHNDDGRGMPAREFLTKFAQYLNRVQPGINWYVSTHLYPAILYETTIWNSDLNDLSYDASFIDGKNLFYLTNYIKEHFGEQHRVMLTEQGFSDEMGPEAQAASLAYSYYAAMYDPMVDCFILNHENSGPAVLGQSLNFDLTGTLAGEVYKRIGNGNQADQDWIASVCLPVIGVSSWAEIIPYYGANSSPKPEIDYSAVYDEGYYYDHNPDVANAFGRNADALKNHFVNSGMAEGRVASAEFNINVYKANYPDLVAVFGNDNRSYYLHYINGGKAEGRIASGSVQAAGPSMEEYATVFDAGYYYKNYSDLAAAFGNNANLLFRHFVDSGMAEGRVASTEFDINIYKANYPDLVAVFGNDNKSYYLHYIGGGKAEGRTASGSAGAPSAAQGLSMEDCAPVFNAEYYYNTYNDLAAAFGNNVNLLFRHFVDSGMAEGRIASAEFDINIYKANYPDLVAVFGEDNKSYYLHYIGGGKAEGRTASEVIGNAGAPSVELGLSMEDCASVFNADYYHDNNGDLAAVFGNDAEALFAHFVLGGMAEGRVASAEFDINVYKANYPDLVAAFGEDNKSYYLHYIGGGKAEGRVASNIALSSDISGLVMMEISAVGDDIDATSIPENIAE